MAAEPEAEPEPAAGDPAEPADRWARWLFAALSVVALVFFLVVGRHQWFFFDEWNFLAGRTLNVHGLLDQHGGHLVLLPVVVYRAMYFVFGLHSYLPYQLMIVVLHVGTAWLLRAVMRRAGVRPWIATAAAALFLFFGAGGQNILWAFQITFVGSLAFGLGQLLLADHEGPFGRRDWLGLAAGFGAIACSGVGLVMLGVVGIAVLVRRGWRAAAVQVAPPALVWLVWARVYSKHNPTTTNPRLLWRWVRLGGEGTFNAMGQVPFVGWLLAVMLVVGLGFAWRALGPGDRRRGVAIPAAFLAGTGAFLLTTGVSRLWAGLAGATVGRYLYITAALLLPVLAVAAEALAARSRAIAAVVIVLLVVGIPGSLSKTTDSFQPAKQTAAYRQMMLSLPRLALAREVPPSLHPEPNQAPDVTIGWLLGALHDGRLPRPAPADAKVAASYDLRLELEQFDAGNRHACDFQPGRTDHTLRLGQSLVVRGGVGVQLRSRAGVPLSTFISLGTSFHNSSEYHALKAVVRPITIRVVPLTKRAGAC